LAEAGHIEYNQQIAKSQAEQLLLNLVRLRYGDTPFFVEVTSINSTYILDAKASATGAFTHGKAPSGAAEADIGWTDSPSVIFTPFGGDKFAKALLSPIPLETLLLLPQNGWSIERVLLCCVQSLNGVLNEPGAGGPTPTYQPVYQDFHRIARLLRELQIARLLEIHVEKSKVPSLGFELTGDHYKVTGPKAKEEEESSVLLHILDQKEAVRKNPRDGEMLSLRADRYKCVREELRKSLKLDPPPEAGQPDEIQISLPQEISSQTGRPNVGILPRSLLGVFYYLSNAVEIPVADADAEKVIQTIPSVSSEAHLDEPDGRLCRQPAPVELKNETEPSKHPCPGQPSVEPRHFDWTKVTGDLLRVCEQESKPPGAYLAVRHRGHWFYIQDEDQKSKSTFALLMQLFSLQSGEKTQIPILTTH
jgi:hypothetical protein